MTTATDNLAIDLHHVAKTYKRKVKALKGITMQVHPGEVFGLLGPNGAGKSTLVKIMMTIVRANQAQGTLLGRPLGDKSALRRIGYLPEHHRFPTYLTGQQALMFYGAMAEVPRDVRKKRAAELLDLVDMTAWARTKVSQYSKGMQQRVGLAQALMGDPDLVLLDEPTDGVDPVGRRDIRDLLVRLREQGKTIFLNSHLLSELEMVCDRVAILVGGEVRLQGALDELTKESWHYNVALEGQPPTWLTEMEEVTVTPGREGRLVARLPHADAGKLQPVIDRLRAEGVVIAAIEPKRESLEDLFMRAVQESGGEARQMTPVGGGGEEGGLA